MIKMENYLQNVGRPGSSKCVSQPGRNSVTPQKNDNNNHKQVENPKHKFSPALPRTSNSLDTEYQSKKQMALANDVVQYFISLMGKKVRKVRIIRDIM